MPTTSQPRRRRRRWRWAIALAAALAALLAAEGVLHALALPKAVTSFAFLVPALADDDVFVSDDELFWKLNADTAAFEANALGFRGPWPRAAKRGDELRIACIGDSCTFGGSMRIEETYGWLVMQRLQREMPARVVRTVLGAMPGYSSHQSRVVYERYVAPLQPDVTVTYVGAWNDYSPAIGANDRQRAAGMSGLRLVRLARRLLTGRPSRDRAAYLDEMRAGRAPEGRRVPLPHYRDNVRAILARAQQLGSWPIVVLPPLPAATLRDFPIALEYRAATAEVAASLGADVVDAPALFAEFARALPAGYGTEVCFRDWVHPSARGHALLAEHLLALLRRRGWAAEQRPPTPRLTIAHLEPTEVEALAPATVELQLAGAAASAQAGAQAGAQPSGAARPALLWIGGRWARHLEPLGAGRWRAHLPDALPPGAHAVEWSGEQGLATAAQPLAVRAVPLHVEVARRDDQVELDLRLRAPPGWRVALWIAPALREAPEPTPFGPFWLQAAPGGRPAQRPDLPFHFAAVALPHLAGEVGADGVFRVRHTYRHGDGAPRGRAWVQGLVSDLGIPRRGAVTAVAPLELGR